MFVCWGVTPARTTQDSTRPFDGHQKVHTEHKVGRHRETQCYFPLKYLMAILATDPARVIREWTQDTCKGKRKSKGKAGIQLNLAVVGRKRQRVDFGRDADWKFLTNPACMMGAFGTYPHVHQTSTGMYSVTKTRVLMMAVRLVREPICAESPNFLLWRLRERT